MFTLSQKVGRARNERGVFSIQFQPDIFGQSFGPQFGAAFARHCRKVYRFEVSRGGKLIKPGQCQQLPDQVAHPVHSLQCLVQAFQAFRRFVGQHGCLYLRP